MELERHTTGVTHGVFDDAAQLLQMRVTWDDVHVRVADRDERLSEIRCVTDLARGSEQTTVGRAMESAFDRIGAHGKG
jgi:hypothetical protein